MATGVQRNHVAFSRRRGRRQSRALRVARQWRGEAWRCRSAAGRRRRQVDGVAQWQSGFGEKKVRVMVVGEKKVIHVTGFGSVYLF